MLQFYIFKCICILDFGIVFRNDEYFGCSSKNNGVDMDNVRKLMNRIVDVKNVNIIQQVMQKFS